MQFLKVAHELITDANITSNEFRIYSYLMSRYNKHNNCAYPSIEVIAKKVSISISTVKRSIKRLVELGYMIIEKKKGVNGNYNEYKNFKFLIADKKFKGEGLKVKVVQDEKKECKNHLIVSDYKENGMQMKIEEVSPYTIEHQQKISLVLKQGIKLTEKQRFILGDMDLEVLREALRIFKKKNGKKFTFLMGIYLDIAEKKLIEISNDIEKYLCGSYIRMTQEERETQQALRELEMYGVSFYV